MQIISPPTFCFLASISVITPFGVDTIAIPKPLFIFGKLSADEKILLPGFDTLSKALITGSDKQLVGEVVSKIKTLRKIEPYKGKGVREKGQYVLKKEGKKK